MIAKPRGAIAACVLVLATTCTPVPLGDGPRRQVVRALTEQVVRPAQGDVAARAAELTAAIRSLAGAPSQAALDAAQDAWRAARAPWKECDAFAFGPAMDDRLAVAIDQLPVEPVKIEAEIAGTAALTADYIETIGADRKGFHAIEHLAFGAGDDAAVLDPQVQRQRWRLGAGSWTRWPRRWTRRRSPRSASRSAC